MIFISPKEKLISIDWQCSTCRYGYVDWRCCNEIFQLKEEDFFRLNPIDLNLKPRWNTKTTFSDEATHNLFREKFEAGDRVAFKVPIKYHPVNGKAKTVWYDAFLEKDTTLTKPEYLFVRDGITISGISSLDRGLVRGIVIIHDIDLARMLGDSENPAHTEWQPDSRNFKDKYIDGKEALIFVKSNLKKFMISCKDLLKEYKRTC